MSYSKFRAKPTVIDGIRFASKRESQRYVVLKFRERVGEITGLELQPEFKFEINGKPVLSRSERYPNGRQLKMVADFKYVDTKTGETVWEDSKGFRTQDFIIKKAFFEALSGQKLQEIR